MRVLTALALLSVAVFAAENDTSTAGSKCTLPCGQFQTCDVYQGEEYCKDVCTPERCAEGERCVLKQVQCIRAPCPPIAVCEPQEHCDRDCGPFGRCFIFNNGFYCADTCAPGRCKKDEVCELVDVHCFTAPCPPIARCKPRA